MELENQSSGGQSAECLVDAANLQSRDLCSYLLAAAILPLCLIILAGSCVVCCTCRLSAAPRPSEVCAGLYGAALVLWWAAAAPVFTYFACTPLPEPFTGAQASRVAVAALFYVQLVLCLVLMVSGCVVLRPAAPPSPPPDPDEAASESPPKLKP